MVTVAKSFDAPIKLLFPRKIPPAPQDFSMLGLGDIVIPGNPESAKEKREKKKRENFLRGLPI